MKMYLPALFAGLLLLAPLCAQAQGYSGLMAPQQGYKPPPPEVPSADTLAAQNGGAVDADPYGGTGASTFTGYSSVTDPNGGGDNDSAIDDSVAATADMDAAQTQAEADYDADATRQANASPDYAASFAPKKKPGAQEEELPKSLYEMIEKSGSTPQQRRQSSMQKAQDTLMHRQEALRRANAEMLRRTNAQVQRTIDAQHAKDEAAMQEQDLIEQQEDEDQQQ